MADSSSTLCVGCLARLRRRIKGYMSEERIIKAHAQFGGFVIDGG